MGNLFNLKPLVITSLHLPDLGAAGKSIPMSWLEDYVVQNIAVFLAGGIQAVFLQDETLNGSQAQPETVAVMSALGRLIKNEFPQLHLGIIVQAHDHAAPLAIAHASGAAFVRLKTFVGAMLKAEGIEEGCGIAAREYRHMLGRDDILMLADVHDRTGYPLVKVPIAEAAGWAGRVGADALILTGREFKESLDYLRAVRQADLGQPLLVGGGVTADNVATVLIHADGVIASSTFKHRKFSADTIIRWDLESIKHFMEAANSTVS